MSERVEASGCASGSGAQRGAGVIALGALAAMFFACDPADEPGDAAGPKSVEYGADPPPAACWDKNKEIVIELNPSLEARLGDRPMVQDPRSPGYPSRGTAADRTASFKAAVQAWKDAIDSIPELEGKLRLKVPNGVTTNYAGDMGAQVLKDDDLLAQNAGGSMGADVFLFTWSMPYEGHKAHDGDGANVCSTGHKHPQVMANPMLPMSDGWIVRNVQAPSGEMGFGGFAIDDVLGLTRTTSKDGKIVEGDILWFTHVPSKTQKGMASLLHFQYQQGGALMRNGMRWYFDWYSIALHEVGHFLGLAHVDVDQQTMNAMRGSLDVGWVLSITDADKKALKDLYTKCWGGGGAGPTGPAGAGGAGGASASGSGTGASGTGAAGSGGVGSGGAGEGGAASSTSSGSASGSGGAGGYGGSDGSGAAGAAGGAGSGSGGYGASGTGGVEQGTSSTTGVGGFGGLTVDAGALP